MSDDVAALNSVPTEEELNQLQLTTLQYYLHEANPANGLIRDKTDASAPCSIAAVGLALATIPVLVERGVDLSEFGPRLRCKPALLETASRGGADQRAQRALLPSST